VKKISDNPIKLKAVSEYCLHQENYLVKVFILLIIKINLLFKFTRMNKYIK